MPPRPPQKRRTYTLDELVNWIVIGHPFCSEVQGASINFDEFAAARNDVVAALRDGDIQALGYFSDTQNSLEDAIGVRPMRIPSKTLPEFILHEQKNSRIPSSFWPFASVDWKNSSAKTQTQEFININFLAAEVWQIWPISDVSLINGDKIGNHEMAQYAPASDRVVTLDHNSAPYKEAIAKLDEATSAVQSANDIGAASQEEREAVVSELTSLRKLLENTRVRVQAILALAGPAFNWIAKTFTQEGLKRLASEALDAIKALL